MAASVGATWQVPEVHVFHGASCTGKTFRADQMTGSDVYRCTDSRTCLRQYSGQANVFLDDVRGELPVDLLLALLDRYAHPQCRRVVITSNAPPERWYPDLEDDTKRALLRRLGRLASDQSLGYTHITTTHT